MKVILLSDVKGRGKEGDVIEVARGFATNYLLPRKMAIQATPGNLKQLEARVHNIKKREEAKRSEAEVLAAKVEGSSIVIEAKAGDTGKLFGSVTGGMVADALIEQIGVDVDRRKLDLHGHIKTLGEHVIDVRLYDDVTAQVTLNVVPLGGVPVAEPEAPTAEEIVAEAEAMEAEAEAEADAVAEAEAAEDDTEGEPVEE
ncbi:MAG TPA: 50S ribosomal protein L9 [Coriobacteriia bacterium]|jgi:large subunit ribosomal protein L9|uniref:50S ribosomal protein L9 n=1 Tax=Anaerosoma tenue TaxID=2933588 RepID=UPI00076BF9BD|nr:50S ribosomal protein L9 [Anaerosoma tenue]KUK48448.1 MAG: 50S ribosomal protein L9 [Actinobacteria bacterium 66_15]MCK8115137.1 50S ribosomal protein L9 [Anaerosoma tenue]HAL29618.1 50S ribosomal protein L9 [Coriobacteriia bacterium]